MGKDRERARRAVAAFLRLRERRFGEPAPTVDQDVLRLGGRGRGNVFEVYAGAGSLSARAFHVTIYAKSARVEEV